MSKQRMTKNDVSDREISFKIKGQRKSICIVLFDHMDITGKFETFFLDTMFDVQTSVPSTSRVHDQYACHSCSLGLVVHESGPSAAQAPPRVRN